MTLFGDEIEAVHEFDPLTGEKTADLKEITVYANSHYVTPRPTLTQAIRDIKVELKVRLDELHGQGKLLEAQRLEQRTTFDIEMIETTGFVQVDRELLAVSDRTQAGRAAADIVRIFAGECAADRG